MTAEQEWIYARKLIWMNVPLNNCFPKVEPYSRQDAVSLSTSLDIKVLK